MKTEVTRDGETAASDAAAGHLNVLIILGHPRPASFSESLAEAYAEGARSSGAAVRLLVLAEMHFEPNVLSPSPAQQPLEPDLRKAQELIRWAHHIVFVYPTWWGTAPALLKGFLDRTLTPGFAFVESTGGTGFEPRLRGRSAHLITTMDTPAWVYRWIYRQPGHNALRRAALGFCGIGPTRTTVIGPIKDSAAAQRQQWLQRICNEGAQLHRGPLSRWERVRVKASAWTRGLRLQFYPMTWMAYTVGALAAGLGGSLSAAAYWAGYLCLFLLEVATVLTNDIFDFDTDRRNAFYSMFTGGSRVLVDRELSRREVRWGVALALAGAAIAASLTIYFAMTTPLQATIPLAVLAILALGYTMPPLKLSHRGLGELDVATTHSFGVILCGYVWQGGSLSEPLPWLLALPLFFAVLPAIVLAGIPDRIADAASGKRTLVVQLGPHRAIGIAALSVAIATLLAVTGSFFPWTAFAFRGISLGVVPHGLFLLYLMWKTYRRAAKPGRIDRLLGWSLALILWFALVPMIRLFQQ